MYPYKRHNETQHPRPARTGLATGVRRMAEFKRARSAEQKCQRMAEVKAVALRQFQTRPYHEITLTTIADELKWSRANLYKYAATKEEVFLALGNDLRAAYYDALMSAFPEGCDYSRDTMAEVWTGLVVAHVDWFRLHALLFTILERNASIEKLIEFKQGHYQAADAMAERFEKVAGIPREKFWQFMAALNYHAMGIATDCCGTPAIQEALSAIGRAHPPADLRAEMREFIPLCLEHWGNNQDR